jgi:hypothetical protein
MALCYNILDKNKCNVQRPCLWGGGAEPIAEPLDNDAGFHTKVEDDSG